MRCRGAVTEKGCCIPNGKKSGMIYLKRTTEPQEVRLTRSWAGTPGRLELCSDIDHRVYSLDVEVVKSGPVSDTLRVSLPKTCKAWELPEGEWTYELLDTEGDPLSTGVAVVGDYAADRSTNEDNEIIYQQYGND